MKTLLKLVAAAAILAAVAWTASYLYWHVKILGAIRTLETQSVPIVTGSGQEILAGGEAYDTLASAGCRSLPHLIAAMNSPKNPEVMSDAFHRIFAVSLPTPSTDPDVSAAMRLLAENRLSPGETAAKRQEKIDRIRAWWRASGDKFHQSWRVWSSKCLSP